MRLSVQIYKGEKYYIARIPELNVTTQGKTREEAKKNLKEAAKLHLETVIDYMIKRGNIKIEDNKISVVTVKDKKEKSKILTAQK